MAKVVEAGVVAAPLWRVVRSDHPNIPLTYLVRGVPRGLELARYARYVARDGSLRVAGPAQLGDHVHRKAARLQRSARRRTRHVNVMPVELHARGDKTVDGGGMDLGRGAVRLGGGSGRRPTPCHLQRRATRAGGAARRRHRWQEPEHSYRGVRERNARIMLKRERDGTLMHE